MPLINQGMVIPLISNSFRIEQLFREEKNGSAEASDASPSDDEDWTVDEQLTKEWAEFIEYPMPDVHNLARIAQYFLVEQKDPIQARAKYVDFLKALLLTIAQDDEGYVDLVNKLKAQTHEQRFSEIVRKLDYPRFPENTEDPLRLLARLPLPIFITTSYYDFLERALDAEGKTPHTQICFWSGTGSNARAEHRPDPNYQPSPTHPAVYHLFGIEDYPQTLVLSEDDYMNFLISVVEDTNTQNPIVPLRLRQALAESPLLLLGYQLRDWDFRVLFRFVLRYRKEELSPRGMVIQLKPDRKRIGNMEKALEYLSHYLDKKQFDVEWTDTDSFIRKLWDEWNQYGQGQS
ncbi:MAG TPA: SIR2 family protein [Anaerolineales bacterium]|nr:SIR2 family protein [Anaerolineales bacterium]